MNRKKHIIGVFGFILLALFLTFNRHSKTGYFNYKSEIWADKAGFYIYLPAVLKYNLDPKLFPESIDKKLGNGFQLDLENNKVHNKYTCGVAILQLPFYLMADLLARPMGYKADGFSPIYHWAVNIAAIFYLVFGLIFLKEFLSKRYSLNISYGVPLILFFGSNLFFYSIDETGMSHVYSFFLFSLLLFLLDKSKFMAKTSLVSSITIGIVMGLIVLIRPTNIIFLSVLVFLDLDSRQQFLLRFKRILSRSLPLSLGIFIAILPQLLYWKYLHGSYVVYSYGEEGFNWSNPQLMLNWFSTKNGLFTYTPLYFIIVIALFWMIKKRIRNGLFITLIFLGLSYVLSCWWDWSFGCSFGARSYIEYLALLSLPLAFLFEQVKSMKLSKIIGFGSIISLIIVLNFYQSYSYDNCFYGGYWDWNTYFQFLKN